MCSQALQYIFHKSGYHFQKGAVARQFTREITGPGILFAQGMSFSCWTCGRGTHRE